MTPEILIGHFSSFTGSRSDPGLIQAIDTTGIDAALLESQMAFPNVDIAPTLQILSSGYIRLAWHAHPSQKLFLKNIAAQNGIKVWWASTGGAVDRTMFE